MKMPKRPWQLGELTLPKKIQVRFIGDMTFGRISKKLPEAEEKKNVCCSMERWVERVNCWEDDWIIGLRQL